MHQENLVAHRGYPLHYPENTIAGIEAALAAGAKYVEVDIQLTRDGMPVVLQRLCQQSGAIHDYPWQQVRQFMVHGSSELPMKLNTVPIASLQDLVIVIKASPGVRFFIELKRISVEQFGAKRLVETVLASLQPVGEQCIVISYSLEALQQVRRQSKLPVGVVIDEWRQHTEPAIANLQPEFLFFDINSIPSGESLQYPGARLVVFETTDPPQARAALQQGVDLVETFAIGEMRQQLASGD